jgi:hypothetical protein
VQSLISGGASDELAPPFDLLGRNESIDPQKTPMVAD